MNYPNQFISITIGHKNSAGDWILDEQVEVLAIATACSQIVITPSLPGQPKRSGGKYNLTHVQSGFFLLGGFHAINDAREAAIRLTELFPIEDWNALGQMAQSWRRRVVRDKYHRLSPEDKIWMHQHGGPRP